MVLFQGVYYMLIEYISQLYRCSLPIMPWVYFLREDDGGYESPKWFSYILILLYFIFKVRKFYQMYIVYSYITVV